MRPASPTRPFVSSLSSTVISKEPAAAAETAFVDIDLVPTGTYTGTATLENAADHSSTAVYVKGSSSVAVTDGLGDYELAGVPKGRSIVALD